MKDHAITHMALVPVLLAAFEKALDEKLDVRPAWQRAIKRDRFEVVRCGEQLGRAVQHPQTRRSGFDAASGSHQQLGADTGLQGF